MMGGTLALLHETHEHPHYFNPSHLQPGIRQARARLQLGERLPGSLCWDDALFIWASEAWKLLEGLVLMRGPLVNFFSQVTRRTLYRCSKKRKRRQNTLLRQERVALNGVIIMQIWVACWFYRQSLMVSGLRKYTVVHQPQLSRGETQKVIIFYH